MALLVGVAYFVVGRLFAVPEHDVRAWRLAAWAVSAALYASHVAYEHFKLRSSLRTMAWHVTVAVAIGAFALAFAGMMRTLSIESTIRPRWLLALALWPAFTAVPAYLGALVAGAVLARLRRGSVAE